MRDVVICDGVRTPRGKGSPRGGLHAATPIDLVAGLLGALAHRGVRTADDVLLGCATQTGVQGGNLARTAALVAGWDPAVPGATINRFCASGLDAVNTAAARVRAGDADVIVAGGVESVSRVPAFADGGPLYADPAVAARVGSIHMGVAADLVATLDGVTRDALDDYADATRAKARAAWASGAAGTSVVPTHGLARDELVDYAPTRAELAALPPLFAEHGAAGQDAVALARYPQLAAIRHLHTRGTSPALADAAAVLAVAERTAAERAGLRPRARVLATATCAGDPVAMLTAGQAAATRAIARAELAPRDVDVFVVAEAFAALCLRFMRDLDAGHDRFNPGGGTIALGHAFGATGAILVLDVVDHLERTGARHGVAAVSGAAGLGAALVVERLA